MHKPALCSSKENESLHCKDLEEGSRSFACYCIFGRWLFQPCSGFQIRWCPLTSPPFSRICGETALQKATTALEATLPPLALAFPIHNWRKMHWRKSRATHASRRAIPSLIPSPGEPLEKVRASMKQRARTIKANEYKATEPDPPDDANSCSAFRNANKQPLH